MKPQILFVDDNLEFLESYQSILEKEGYEVTAVSNADDALQSLKRGTNFDLVLADLSLPKRDGDEPDGSVGLQLLDAIRVERPGLPVIVLSAYLERFAKDLGMLGIAAFISKGSPDAIRNIKKYIGRIISRTDPQYLFDEPSVENLRQLIIAEIDKYSPIRERTLFIPGESSFQLIKPLVGFKREIEERIVRYPFEKNVFLMMKFRESNRELGEYVVENLSRCGLRGIRADDEAWNITNNIYNPIAVLYCCKYGIALFDEPEKNQAYSANVAYELGMMHYQNKHCLLLRHKSLPIMPFDLNKDLYVTYERDLQVKQLISSWIKQIAAN